MQLNPDRAAALVLIALAAVAIALTYGFAEVPAAVRQGMGPEVFPRLVAGAIIVMSLVLFLTARGAGAPLPAIDRAVPLVMAGGVGFMGAMWLVGITVAMGLAMVALGILWGERRWMPMLANAVLLPAAIWALFVKGLKVPLPTGIIGQMMGW